MALFSPTDEAFMREALELAARGRGATSPNPMVGALIVAAGRVAGRGYHARAGEPHAEILALKDAGAAARGATLYCTLEPCCHHGRTPPCTGAIVAAGVTRAIVGAIDPSAKASGKGIEALRAAGIEVETGCLEREARALNEHFNVFHERGRPFVTVKWAMTLDGRTATDGGDSKWVSGEASRRYVHELRRAHDAVLCGIGTVEADDPLLNVRLDGFAGRQPRRVIVDTILRISPAARVLTEPGGGEVIVIGGEGAAAERRRTLEAAGHRVELLPVREGRIDMAALMAWAKGEGMQSFFCEGGRRLHTALLRAGAVDKVVAFVAPKIAGGGEARGPVEDLEIAAMSEAIELKRVTWKTFGGDLCLEGYLRDEG